jgi:hypothetical protein
MQRPPHHRLCVAAVCALTTALLAGCGIVSQVKTAKTVSVRVTENFGATTLQTGTVAQLSSPTGALALTGRFAKIAAHGQTVDSINGHSAGGLRHWTLYVNGISVSGANPTIHDGDHVWWDLHTKAGASQVPAIVGSYPEPFTNGSGGRTFPTVLTCAGGLTTACNEVSKDLDAVGVKVSYQGLGTGSGSDSLAMLIGTYQQLRGVIATELLGAGPAKSGVYAQFGGRNNSVLEVDNTVGETQQALNGSYGVIAATEEVGFSEPVWLITGTDQAGVNAAAQALNVGDLKSHFAVAVTTRGRILPLPAG